MLSSLLPLGTGELLVASLFALFLVGSSIGGLLFLRRLTSLQQQMLQWHTSQQDELRQLQLAQASTQATVAATQQETLRLAQELSTQHQATQVLMQEVKTLHSTSQTIMMSWQKDTSQLSQALRTTYQQGIWGEQELLRVVELAGMVQHCDFESQLLLPSGQKPDLIIHLHNNRSIAVDAKAPSQAYLEAMRCEEEATRISKLKAYARAVRETMNDLAKRDYWKQLQPAPELVILFLPNEAMFRAALEYDFRLLELASEKNILLASPVTLIALLKAIAYGWSQEYRAQHVQQIVDRSQQFYRELDQWLRQWQQLKKALQTASTEFNKVAAGYEARILPVIKELNALDDTLPLKEKTLELKPLAGFPHHPPEAGEAKQPQKEQGNSFWQNKLTDSFKVFRALLPHGGLDQENTPSP